MHDDWSDMVYTVLNGTVHCTQTAVYACTVSHVRSVEPTTTTQLKMYALQL